jgi:hypothetical protein
VSSRVDFVRGILKWYSFCDLDLRSVLFCELIFSVNTQIPVQQKTHDCASDMRRICSRIFLCRACVSNHELDSDEFSFIQVLMTIYGSFIL